MNIDHYESNFDFMTSPDSLAQEIMEKFVLIMYYPETPSNASYGYSTSQTMPNQNYDAWRINSIRMPIVHVMHGFHHGNALAPKVQWLLIGESNTHDLSFDQISAIVSSISSSLHSGEFRQVDDGLVEADPTKMSPDAIVAISRITYPARVNLEHWKHFVERASQEMTRRGQPKNLMAGLI